MYTVALWNQQIPVATGYKCLYSDDTVGEHNTRFLPQYRSTVYHGDTIGPTWCWLVLMTRIKKYSVHNIYVRVAETANVSGPGAGIVQKVHETAAHVARESRHGAHLLDRSIAPGHTLTTMVVI